MTTPQLTGKPASFQLPPDLQKPVDDAEEKLKTKGVTRSQLLAESVRDGLPSAFRRLSKRKPRLSLLEAVEDVVGKMNGDITRRRVEAALQKDHAITVKGYDARVLAQNVLGCLRRLVNRDVLEENGQAEQSAAKGQRKYQSNVYRRKTEKK